MLKGLNWAGVVVALIVTEVLSYVWYGQIFGPKIHDLMDPASTQGVGIIEGLVLAALCLVGTAWVVRATGSDTWSKGAVTGAMIWFFFGLTGVTMGWLYLSKGPGTTELLQANIGFDLLFFVIGGACAGGLRLGGVKTAPA